MTALPSTLALLLFQTSSLPQELPEENGLWLCWSYSGKGSRAIPIHESHPIQWFTSHIAEFDAEVKQRLVRYREWENFTAEVTRIGVFAGLKVADVMFRTADASNPLGKMVLVGDRGRFRPVVWILADTTVLFAPSRIVNVANRAVLVSRHRIDGTGNFYFEDYFIFDRQQNLPVNLAVGRATAAELSKVLPPGRSVWKGGGFDVASLHYASGVWKDGDANCCPSGGRVNIQFGIRGNTIVV